MIAFEIGTDLISKSHAWSRDVMAVDAMQYTDVWATGTAEHHFMTNAAGSCELRENLMTPIIRSTDTIVCIH